MLIKEQLILRILFRDMRTLFFYAVRTKTVQLIAALLLLSVQMMAQSTLTLDQSINAALKNRKNIQAGKLDVSIRKLQTEALLKKYWPQLSFEYSYLYNPILQTSILPIGMFNANFPPDAMKAIQFGTNWTQSADLVVQQPLIDVSIKRQVKEFELQEKISASSQAQTEYDLAYTVAQTYLNIGLQEKQIQSAVTDTNRTRISYQLQKDKFDAKRLLKSDLNKAQINHNNAIQKLRDAISQLIEDKVYLLFLIGESDSAKADFAIDAGFFKQDQLLRSDLQLLKDSIPELRQLELQGNLISLQAQSEKAKYIPTLNLKGHLGANQYTNNFNPIEANSWYGSSYVGIDMKVPLLFGEDKQSKLQQLQQQGLQYHQQREDKTAQYQKDAITAKIKMNRVIAQIKTFEDNISLSNETIRIMQERVKEGQETSSALNTEETSLQNMEAEEAIAKKQLWLYWLDYLKSSGQLSKLWK